MKQMFRTYSHLLQLRPDAIAHYLDSQHAGRSLRLFVVVMLIAGLGTWLGVPQALRQLTLPEQVDLMAESAGEATAQIVAAVLPVLTKTENAAQVAVSTVRQQVMQVTGWVGEMAAGVSQELTAGRTQIENNALVQQLQHFNENASEQVPYLAALASRLRDYLQS